jgi:hypothetical protein
LSNARAAVGEGIEGNRGEPGQFAAEKAFAGS